MLKTVGITAEYNPFHNGHARLIEEARKKTGCDAVIAVMSGNFVQRGEPAILDKWKRAEAAVRGGADVVIELPFLSCVQRASVFASDSISMMAAAGIDYVCFGSECGNLENLQDIADTPVNPDHFRVLMQEGASYPKAYSLLTRDVRKNDLLGICYLKAMKNTGMKPVIVERNSDYASEEMHPFASASAIRKAVSLNEDISYATPMAKTLQEEICVFPSQLYPYLRTLLLTSPRSYLQECFLCDEGIEKVMTEHAVEEDTYEGFLKACTSYRYTASRIRRISLQIMLHVTREEAELVQSEPKVLRVLAFNNTGRQWLKEVRKNRPDLRIASRFASVPEHRRELEYRTAMLYGSVLPEPQRRQIIKKEIRGSLLITE